ncbi:MAG: ROK family protein [Treponema sp.]|nr:ROK family protein [Treponema sp.]
MERVLCGVDLGGTKLSVGLVSESGTLLAEETVHDHVGLRPDDIVATIGRLVRGLLGSRGLTETSLIGIGVGTAGHVRRSDGSIIAMSNLPGFKGYPFRERLQSSFSAPVAIDNDANAQAYGEFRYGAGKAYSDFVFMTVSTQIGAGIVLGGKLYRGMTGTAGELGHTLVDPEGEDICPCGNRGCLIAKASGVALRSTFRRQLAAGKSSRFVDLATLESAAIDGPLVARGLAAGDEACEAVMREFGRWIGIGVYNAFQTFNPKAVILGGGLMNWGEPFMEVIKATFKRLAGDMIFDEMPILRASLEASGVIGAAALLLEE